MNMHRGIEIALEKISPTDWKTSPIVTQALICCPRLKRMASNALRRFGVSQDYVEEVVQDVSLVLQTKVLANGLGENRGQLRDISDTYFVIYKVVDLTVRNYQKKRSYAAVNMVSAFSDVQFEDESQDEMMGRFVGDAVDEGGYDKVHQEIDAQSARNKLKDKINRLGWPSHILKERLVRGRPSKH